MAHAAPRGPRIAGAGRIGAILVAASVCLASAGPAAAAPARRTPDIVVILTDDQRWDSWRFMPTVRRQLARRGTVFENAFVVNALCCPSRVSILTGRYSHGTGVYENGGAHGGFDAFRSPKDASTIATWLDEAGYRTALVGKYLNGYDDADASAIPPGWDVWYALTTNTYSYNGYHVSDGGRVRAPAGYQTDRLAERATQVIRGADRARPLFLYFSPVAPHLPSTPPVRYRDAFASMPTARPPSYDEPDVSDKPPYIRRLPRLAGTDEQAFIDDRRRKSLQSLLAVDDAVRGILRALRATGRLSETLIVFASDNGFLFGEHRWLGKMVPYEESIRIPMIVRFDRIDDGPRRDRHLVLNVDLAPTLAAAAGAEPASETEGRSLLRLLRGRRTPAWRRAFVIEHSGGGSGGTPGARWWSSADYCAVRTKRFTYVAYDDGPQELYDLRADPHQLSNRASDPDHRTKLRNLRARAKALCRPAPPGWTRW